MQGGFATLHTSVPWRSNGRTHVPAHYARSRTLGRHCRAIDLGRFRCRLAEREPALAANHPLPADVQHGYLCHRKHDGAAAGHAIRDFPSTLPGCTRRRLCFCRDYRHHSVIGFPRRLLAHRLVARRPAKRHLDLGFLARRLCLFCIALVDHQALFRSPGDGKLAHRWLCPPVGRHPSGMCGAAELRRHQPCGAVAAAIGE